MKSLPELSDWRSEEHEDEPTRAARPSYVARSELNTDTVGRPAYADPLMIESPRAAARSSHPIDDEGDAATRSPRDSYAMLEGLEATRLPRPSYVARSERSSGVAAAAANAEPLATSSDSITNYTAQKALNNLISQESITTFAPASLGAALSRSRAAQMMNATGSRSKSDSVTAYHSLPPPPTPPSPRSSRVLLAGSQDRAHSTTVADPYAHTQAAPSLFEDEDALEPLPLDSSELEELDPIHALSYPSHDDLVSMEQGELARTNEQPDAGGGPTDYDALRRYLFDQEDDEKPTQAREVPPASRAVSFDGPPSTVAPRRSRPEQALSAEEGRTPVASLLPKLAQMQRVMEERQRLSMLPPHERFPQPHTPHAFLPPPPPRSFAHAQSPVHDHTYAMNNGGMMSPPMMPIADRTFTFGTNPSNPNLSGSSSLAPESWAESPWIVPATPRPSSQVPTERSRNKVTNGFAFGLPWTPQLAAFVIASATLLMVGIVVVVAVFVRTATAPPPPTFSSPAPNVLPSAAATSPAAAATAPPVAPVASGVVPPVASGVVIAPPPVAEPPPVATTSAGAAPSPKASSAPPPTAQPKKFAATSGPTNAPRDISPSQGNQGAGPSTKKKPESKGPKSLEDILSELGEQQVKPR